MIPSSKDQISQMPLADLERAVMEISAKAFNQLGDELTIFIVQEMRRKRAAGETPAFEDDSDSLLEYRPIGSGETMVMMFGGQAEE